MFAGSCRIVAPFSSLGTCSLLDTRWHAEHASQFMRYGRRHRRHAAGFARTKTDPIGLLRWTGRLTSWGTTWSLPCLASLAPWTMSLLTLQRCASRDRRASVSRAELPRRRPHRRHCFCFRICLGTCHHGTVRFDGTPSRSITFLIMPSLE